MLITKCSYTSKICILKKHFRTVTKNNITLKNVRIAIAMYCEENITECSLQIT